MARDPREGTDGFLGHHEPCPCGCGELADECPRGSWVDRLFGDRRRGTRTADPRGEK